MGIAAVAAGASIAASAASVGSALADSGGGSSGGALPTSGGSPSIYQPQNPGWADTNYQALVNSFAPGAQGYYGSIAPQIGSYAQQALNNPYAPAALQGASNISSLAANTVAPAQLAGAQALQGAGMSALPYGATLLGAGFDPEHALYNRTQQQYLDQLSAVNASSGLSGTPYGAGVIGQGLENFNIDWQNNQLNRELAATQGYGNLISGAGRSLAGASALGTSGLDTLQSSFNLPYQTYQGQLGNDLGVLGTENQLTTGALGPAQQGVSDLGQYLQLTGSAGNLALANQQAGFNQGQTVGGNIGTSIASLANTFSDPNTLSALGNIFAPAPTIPTQPYAYNPIGTGDSSPLGGFTFNSPY